MPERILITGYTGFAGSHLADHILTFPDVEVYGIQRWRSRTDLVEHLDGLVSVVECDLRDQTSVTRLIAEIRPTKIFHLAAQSYVPVSWSAPEESLHTNLIGTLHLFEALRGGGIDPMIMVAGSSEEYGLVHPDELPIKETNPFRPLSPYAVSKAAMDMLAYQYFQSYGMKIVRTRGFNHTGPRRGHVFVVSNFAKQIAEIEAGKRSPAIQVGNLEAKRDFTDVRDMVRAYWLSLQKCEPGETYNICSGKNWTIQEVLDKLLVKSEVEIKIESDPARLRPSDVPVLLGDNTKFQNATGWRPEIPFEQTLQDTLNYWRENL